MNDRFTDMLKNEQGYKGPFVAVWTRIIDDIIMGRDDINSEMLMTFIRRMADQELVLGVEQLGEDRIDWLFIARLTLSEGDMVLLFPWIHHRLRGAQTLFCYKDRVGILQVKRVLSGLANLIRTGQKHLC